ncbi:Glutathione-regulated potassium-efflux system protein KefB [hydrothermal vent metagenome]|uniref:Glutathione-regulated potassium-efflux system protein KefB n=1 Tax=hydrothermal vent metagenome TaxID=652676 RepID=A0A1W1D156_9ZZZZ
MLEIIVATIFIATVLNILLTKYQIPTIIGYIATGLFITQLFSLQTETKSHDLELIAEFGIVFLMFTIGLEFSIQHLSKMKKEVFLHGGLQVGITLIIFFLSAYFIFGLDTQTSLIIGGALALSSTAIVLRILSSNREINKEYGRRSLGILIFQDIMVVPLLLMIGIFASGEVNLGSLLLQTLIHALILFLILWIVGKFILEPFLNQVAKSNSDEIFIGSILFLVMGASLLAHALGFSYSLGALMAGMIIAETHYKHQVEADLIPFRDLLLGIFFISVGMQIDLQIISSYLFIILGLFLAISLIKMVALKTSLALFELGEFGLVLFELASANKLIDTTLSQILIVTIILSMIITPFILKNISAITDFLLGSFKEIQKEDTSKQNIKEHIVVIGYGKLGRVICHKLEKKGIAYLAIEQNITSVKEGKAEGKSVSFGNASQSMILQSLHIENASSIIIAIDNTEKIYQVCHVLNLLVPHKRVIISVHQFDEKVLLQEAYPHYEIVVAREAVARGLVESVLKCEI